MISRRSLLLAAVSSTVAGCGFRLRGEDPGVLGVLPDRMGLTAEDPFAPVIQEMERLLARDGVTLTEDLSEVALIIAKPVFSERILGPLPSQGGQTRDQVELALTVRYSMTEAGQAFVPNTEVRATLIYAKLDAESSAEQSRIDTYRLELERSLAIQLIQSIRLRYNEVLRNRETESG